MAEPEAVTLTAVSIEPNNCPLEEPLNIAMDFSTARDLAHARWEIRFVADTANKRKIVLLGETAPCAYGAGAHSMAFSVPQVNVSHLKRHVLANVGLLLAVLYDGDEEVVQVSMVTQVTADGETLMRSIYNPLD